jgi:hypothetical protein
MSNQNLFDSEYVGEAQTATMKEPESELRKFIRQPIERQELQSYGTSKPVRITIRAKLIDDKS